MKQSAKKRIIIWSIVSGVLTLALISGIIFTPRMGLNIGFLSFSLGDSMDLSEFEESFSREFTCEEVKALNIIWDKGNVRFVPSSSRGITISETNAGDSPMYWRLNSNGELTVYNKKSSFFNFFGFNNSSKNLTVAVPQEYEFDSVSVTCVSAELLADNISAQKLKVSTVSGNTRITELTCDQLEIDAVSAEVSVNYGNFISGDIESVSGNINLCVSNRYATKSLNDIQIETVSGTAVITLPKNIPGFAARHETVSGNITSGFAVVSDGKVFTYGNGLARIKAESVSGNVEIREGEEDGIWQP